MTQGLHEYCEQEGISKDDIINSEIEQVHKEAKNKAFQDDVNALLNEIQTSRKQKHQYFKEVLQGKHQGKKLVQQRIVIEFAEVIDYDKAKLVFEETEADEDKNRKYLQDCSVKIDKAALQFANELQKHETFCVEAFNLHFRVAETASTPELKVQVMDSTTGKVQKLSDVPPEVLKTLKNTLEKVIVTEGEGEEKATEVSV